MKGDYHDSYGASRDSYLPGDIIKRVLASLEARRRWRDAALISIMAEVGARQSEVRGINRDDIEWDAQRILLRTTKSGDEEYIPMGPKTTRPCS